MHFGQRSSAQKNLLGASVCFCSSQPMGAKYVWNTSNILCCAPLPTRTHIHSLLALPFVFSCFWLHQTIGVVHQQGAPTADKLPQFLPASRFTPFSRTFQCPRFLHVKMFVLCMLKNIIVSIKCAGNCVRKIMRNSVLTATD